MSSWADDARRLRRWAATLLVELLIGEALAIGARLAGPDDDRAAAGEVARALDLSGLAIGSGAAYTRHPAQADRFAPWSDHPGAFEHVPAGSLIQPPKRWGEEQGRQAAEAAP